MKVRDEIDISSLNSQITNIVTKTANRTNSTIMNKNEIDFGNVTCHSGVARINQSIEGEVVIDVNFQTEDTEELKTQISALIDAEVDKQVKATTELGSGWGDFSAKNQDVSTLFKQEIKNKVVTNSLSEVINEVTTSVRNENLAEVQDFEMDPCSFKGRTAAEIVLLTEACKVNGQLPNCLDVDQSVAVDVKVKAITDTIMENLGDLTIDMETVLEAKTISDTSATGFAGILDVIADFFSSPYVVAGFVVVAIFAIIYLGRKMLGGGGGGGGRRPTNPKTTATTVVLNEVVRAKATKGR